MTSDLIAGIVGVCEVLHKHNVKHLIIGGTAVALHGYYRVTKNPDGSNAVKHDLDFWFSPTYENYFNLLSALEEFGLDISEFKEERSPNPRKSYFRFGYNVFTLDFLPELKSLSRFGSSFSTKGIVKMQETEIWVINYQDLIREKQENSRPQDLEDIKQLRSIRGEGTD